MRHVIVCEGHDEPYVMAEATHYKASPADRIVLLSSRRGPAYETGNILNIPLQWNLKDIPSPYWYKKQKLRKAISLFAGIRSARFLGDIEDILTNIDASDPDVIYLRNLGRFGNLLKRKCTLRFPGRKIVTSPTDYLTDEDAVLWRTYDPSTLVSIVLPAYNGAEYLPFSIESCLAQTHKNLELIIVDDGSTDETPAIINRFVDSDSRIRHFKNDVNLGLPESLNKGFEVSSGDFLTWTSADNVYNPNAIEYMVQQLCTFTGLGVVYCGMHHINESGALLAPPFGVSPMRPPTGLTRENMVLACFMYRREVMDAVGAYRPEYRYVEDYDFFIRACIHFPAKFYFEPCYFYRWHSGSLTSAHSQKYKILFERLHREHFGSRQNRIMLPTADQLIPAALQRKTSQMVLSMQ
jgi:glycosyltransferase involved in cell wall biosynthesis